MTDIRERREELDQIEARLREELTSCLPLETHEIAYVVSWFFFNACMNLHDGDAVKAQRTAFFLVSQVFEQHSELPDDYK